TVPDAGWMQEHLGRLARPVRMQGVLLRLFAENGIALTNLHLGNFSQIEPIGFVHDLELSRLESETTPAQYFGYVVTGFRNALRNVERLTEVEATKAIPIDWVAEFLHGFGVSREQRASLGPIHHGILDSLLREADDRPLAEIRHPWLA